MHACKEIRGRRDDILGNDAVGDNPPIVIEVVDEMVERVEPLDQPALDSRPFGSFDRARNDIERPCAIDILSFRVDGEGNAHFSDCALGVGLSFGKLALAERCEIAREGLGRRACRARRRKELVEELSRLILRPVDTHYFGSRYAQENPKYTRRNGAAAKRRAPNWCRPMTLRAALRLALHADAGARHRCGAPNTGGYAWPRPNALRAATDHDGLGLQSRPGIPSITEDLNGGHRIGVCRGRAPHCGGGPDAVRHRAAEPASEPDGGGRRNGDRLAARRCARDPAFPGPAGVARDPERANGPSARGRRLARVSVVVASRPARRAGTSVHTDGDGRRSDDTRNTHHRRAIASGARRRVARIRGAIALARRDACDRGGDAALGHAATRSSRSSWRGSGARRQKSAPS